MCAVAEGLFPNRLHTLLKLPDRTFLVARDIAGDPSRTVA
jgi:hypothetical protein